VAKISEFSAALAAIFLLSQPASAQQDAAKPAAAADPAQALTLEKCSQCHTDSMFRDKRQDAQAWEATAYRMVGRGAVWTTSDIKTIAAFLGQAFGPDVPKATH
jgi:mono/diheme cytochrome c family protein